MNTINNQKRNLKAALAVNFHKTWLTNIKKSLGSACTYISHVESKGKYFIKVIMTNSSGGKDTIMYEIKTKPQDLTSNDYKALLTLLKEKGYEQGSTKSLQPTEG